MAQLSYNRIIFTDVNKYDIYNGKYSYHGIMLASKLNQKNGQDYKLLDAIDIDWNGAWVSSLSTYLNTTEDLIYALNSLNNNQGVQEINKDLQKIWTQLAEITSSYITYTSLYDILETSYQRKLISGEFIKIDDESYTISAYGLPTYEYLSSTYTTLSAHNSLVHELQNYYWTAVKTSEEIYYAVKKGIDEVINGADSAFDTLKEIADWILGQNRYIPVEPQEVIDNFEPDTYYWFNEETQQYVLVTNPDDVITDGTVQYYRLENYFTDIKNLIEDVNRIDTTVGSYTINEYGVVSYTGILNEIDDIKITDKIQSLEIDRALLIANDASHNSLTAVTTANKSYAWAEVSYDMAYDAYMLTQDGIANADKAYEMAYSAYVSVGNPSSGSNTYLKISYEDIQSYLDSGNKIYFYSNIEYKYLEASSPYNKNVQYYIYDEKIIATGLYYRVEAVEDDVDVLSKQVEDTNLLAKKALFNLNVNNEGSSYVKLSLSPEQYVGEQFRTISITTMEASVDSKTGIVTSDGIPSISTIHDIYSYMMSWQILDKEDN